MTNTKRPRKERDISDYPEPEEAAPTHEMLRLRHLAAGVVWRAVEDLAHADAEIRDDAYEFLTRTLWDTECVWRAHLPRLNKARVLATAKRRYTGASNAN